jgi:hypothetical protein
MRRGFAGRKDNTATVVIEVQMSQQTGPVALKKLPRGRIELFPWRPFPGIVEGNPKFFE